MRDRIEKNRPAPVLWSKREQLIDGIPHVDVWFAQLVDDVAAEDSSGENTPDAKKEEEEGAEEVLVDSLSAELINRPRSESKYAGESPMSPKSPLPFGKTWVKLTDDKIERIWLGGLSSNQFTLPSELNDAV